MSGQPTVTYRVMPLDLARMLQPGTVSHMFELEDSDPAATAMVEMPLDDFVKARTELQNVARGLGRSLVVVLTRDEGRL